MTPERRTISYGSLDEIMPDVERLLAGHSTVGKWSLAEICNHLATVIRRSIDLPASTQFDPSLLMDADRRREVFESGRLSEGLPQPASAPAVEARGEREEADGLREAIEYFKNSPGPVVGHRYFGPMTRAEWDRLHCIHTAHHLSFAIPTGA